MSHLCENFCQILKKRATLEVQQDYIGLQPYIGQYVNVYWRQKYIETLSTLPHSRCARARALPLREGQCVAVRPRTTTRVLVYVVVRVRTATHILIYANDMRRFCKLVNNEVVHVVQLFQQLFYILRRSRQWRGIKATQMTTCSLHALDASGFTTFFSEGN